MNDFIFDFDDSIPEFDIVVQHVTTEGGGGGQTIEIDSELSTTSNNPVKNKVITVELNKKINASSLATVATSGSYNDLSDKPTIPSSFPVDVELSDTSTNPVQNAVITNALGDKIDYPGGGTSGQVLQKTAEGAQWASIGTPSQEQIYQAVTAYIATHPESLNPLSSAVKSALLQIAEKVAYIDEHGEDYYDALDAALNAKALLSITAVYTQAGTVYDTDSLDSLKSDLVVTAYYDDGTTADVTSASVLSGTLAEGTSTITATYQELTSTFTVTVTDNPLPSGYTQYDYIRTKATSSVTSTAEQRIETAAYANLSELSCEFDFRPVSGHYAGVCIFGRRTASGSTTSMAFYAGNGTLGYHLHGNDSNPTLNAVNDVTHHVKYTNSASSPSTLQIDNESPISVAWSNTNVVQNVGLTLLANPNAATGTFNLSYLIQIGRIVLTNQSGTTVGDYIPCVRDADSVIGIYDIIEQEFHTCSNEAAATIGNSANKYLVGNWS